MLQTLFLVASLCGAQNLRRHYAYALGDAAGSFQPLAQELPYNDDHSSPASMDDGMINLDTTHPVRPTGEHHTASMDDGMINLDTTHPVRPTGEHHTASMDNGMINLDTTHPQRQIHSASEKSGEFKLDTTRKFAEGPILPPRRSHLKAIIDGGDFRVDTTHAAMTQYSHIPASMDGGMINLDTTRAPRPTDYHTASMDNGMINLDTTRAHRFDWALQDSDRFMLGYHRAKNDHFADVWNRNSEPQKSSLISGVKHWGARRPQLPTADIDGGALRLDTTHQAMTDYSRPAGSMDNGMIRLDTTHAERPTGHHSASMDSGELIVGKF